MSKSIYISSILFYLLFISCNSEDARPDERNTGVQKTFQYKNTEMSLTDFNVWATDKENELIKIQNVGELNFIMAYIPKECLAHNELKDHEYTMEEFEKSLNNYKNMSYFDFKIELPDGQGELLKYDLSSAQEYTNRVNYMSFNMDKDIILLQGNDTIHPGLFHFERIFDVAPYAIVSLAFDNTEFDTAKEFTIVYNDRIFNKGIIKYHYQSNILIDLPKISSL